MSLEIQKKGDSLRRQTELSKRYAEERGFLLVGDNFYHDLGVSAFRGKNATEGALGAFIAAAESGAIEKGSYLLIESLDRLSREAPYRALGTLQRILNAGINVVTLAIPQTTYTSEEVDPAKLIYGIMSMVRAHEESAMKSRRVHESWSRKQQLAEQTKVTRLCPLWLELSPDRKMFREVPERVELVRRMFKESIEGAGAMIIANRFHLEGISTWGKGERRAMRWTESYVKKTLANRAVLGEYVPNRVRDGKREPIRVVTGYYPPIVSQDVFDRAAAARAVRRTTGGPKSKRVANLFSSIARCGHCKAPMRYRDTGGGQPPFLVCDTGRRADGCTSRGVPYAPLERSFLAAADEVGLQALLTGSDDARAQRVLQEKLESAQARQLALTERAREVASQLATAGVRLDSVFGVIQQLETDAASAGDESMRLGAELKKLTANTIDAEKYERDFRAAVKIMESLSPGELVALRLMLQQRIAQAVSAFWIFPSLVSRLPLEQEKYLAAMESFLREQGQNDEFIQKILSLERKKYSQDQRPMEWKYVVKFRSGRGMIVELDRRQPTNVKRYWSTDGSALAAEIESAGTAEPSTVAAEADGTQARRGPRKTGPRKPRGTPRVRRSKRELLGGAGAGSPPRKPM